MIIEINDTLWESINMRKCDSNVVLMFIAMGGKDQNALTVLNKHNEKCERFNLTWAWDCG